MGRIVPIASGKGGVGKSILAANLGMALARLGRTVILIDLDLGASNLHLLLGLRNRNSGLGTLLWKKERNLTALLCETGEERLWLIPGDNLLPGTANIEWQVKKRIIREMQNLPADFVIADLGGGSSWNVVDFWLAGNGGLVVTVPEIASIITSYAFLKSAAYRVLTQTYPEGSSERREFLRFAGERTEGGGASFRDFAEDLARRYPARGRAGLEALRSLLPCVVINRAKETSDAAVGRRLLDIADRNLGIRITFGAFLPDDEAVGGSVAVRRPLLDLDPNSPYSMAVSSFARALAASPLPSPIAAPFPLADEDIETLAQNVIGSDYDR